MTEVTPEKNDIEKLVESMELASREQTAQKGGRQPVKGYIRAHRIKGQHYYYYCRGKKEIYLGTAETILKGVRNGSNKGSNQDHQNNLQNHG